VVTRDYSDWSVAPLNPAPTKLWLRLTRQGEAVEVSYSLDGETYVMIRVAYLPMADVVEVGVMCASPEGGGFTVTFKDLVIENG
jgi:regulation of enolase protein 1 (concanavalin A-like superfamily)